LPRFKPEDSDKLSRRASEDDCEAWYLLDGERSSCTLPAGHPPAGPGGRHVDATGNEFD